MSNLNELIIFEGESAYDFAYDLPMNKDFSNPKIYTANGDLSKRWYVYFSYRNPKTGRLKRITPFYGEAHKYKTKEDRLFVLSAYCKKIQEVLKKGYNPFEDNNEFHQKSKEQKNALNSKSSETFIAEQNSASIQQKTVEEKHKTIEEAFQFALLIKKKTVGIRTHSGYSSRVKLLQEYIVENYPEITHINQLTKNVVVQFLNEVLQKTSARSRNNYRIDLSSLMQTMEDNEIIATNFIKKIPVLKAIPERNKTYTSQVEENIFNHLKEVDPTLLLFIKFISFNFLRPIEVCRLKVGDINLIDKTIQFKAKNSPLKTKIIPDILIDELPDLSNLDTAHSLFSPEGIGKEWDVMDENKRDYFSKRFKKVVKDHFGLGKDYGLYSFRHTYITKLYREIAKNASPFEAKSNLMLITGHSSMTALEKYLRDIDAELPADYSHLIRTK
ncbi:tyrosine-type recombinase/integrase [Lutibacter sp.]|uniref:tyrosine-type recombinase/integrase n=1 Tax=Lutibacter sp. TaxID=1925666 RepID=UPI0035681B37